MTQCFHAYDARHKSPPLHFRFIIETPPPRRIEISGIFYTIYIFSLNLHGNNLTSTAGLHFVNLIELDLSANSISCLSGFDSLVNLKDLNLSSNLIKNIPNNTDHFKYLISLEKLNLSYNLLVSIPGLAQLSSKNHVIQEILLHGNCITNPNECSNALKNVRTLKFLDIKDNPIEGRDLRWIFF